MNIGWYSARTAARVARITPQTFQAWIRADLIRPQKFFFGKRPENTYTYDDLLLIRLISRLREQGIPAKTISRALDTIEQMTGDRLAWKRAAMYVSGNVIAVVFPDMPDWSPTAASSGPQKMAVVFFPELLEELRNELVPRNRFKYIDVDPDVLGGSPIVKGTRISTRAVMSVLESSMDPHEAYPALTDDQIREVEEYERTFLQAAA